ncbi:hypothetical protein CYMTET_50051 [Cymbomonas tetramitiformis]|uniref:Uncharacterized protein n=1 Tax=Cymbomonas tetramitiformis TaxID=36881 RepID=A0AAE0ETW6_9CHLO|nr:hypothetical protein CYMTET_50051 [Cymbomonas tetramitiformis]
MASFSQAVLSKAQDTAVLLKHFLATQGRRHPAIGKLQDSLAAVVRGKAANVENYLASFVGERELEDYVLWIAEVFVERIKLIPEGVKGLGFEEGPEGKITNYLAALGVRGSNINEQHMLLTASFFLEDDILYQAWEHQVPNYRIRASGRGPAQTTLTDENNVGGLPEVDSYKFGSWVAFKKLGSS